MVNSTDPARSIQKVDPAATWKIIDEEWEAAFPSLQEFVQIPNLSTAYDPEWATNGLFEQAVDHMVNWVEAQGVQGCSVETFKDEGLSPLMMIEIAATEGSKKAATTFVMYGHLDKQPHGPGWDEDIGPTSGLRRGDKIYGRGAADDGYAVYGCIIAIKALQKQGIDHPRVVIIAECCEESGSPHLGHYIEKLQHRIGSPDVVFCLDSITEDFSTLWMTTSIRGVVMGSVEVGLLRTGLHSGFGGGIVPDAFRVARMLLARMEDTETGKIRLPELFTKVPVERQAENKALSERLPEPHLTRGFAWREGARAQHEDDPYAMYMANLWEPSMTVVGMDGLPPPERAGNVLNSSVRLQVSFRIPPLVDPDVARAAIVKEFERDAPYGATVKASFANAAPGWNNEELSPNIQAAMREACAAYFDGKAVGLCGIGGTIPLMGMLAKMFPEANLIVTGVLGPGTNMHGPNEYLPVTYTKKVTATIAMAMGVLEPETPALPEGVPVPAHPRPRRTRGKKPQFCFSRPDVPIGQCPCCL